MSQTLVLNELNNELINRLFAKLKEIYTECSDKKDEVVSLVNKFGYLPYSQAKALDTLAPGDVIVGLETKFYLNNTYKDNNFNFNELSAVKRAGYKDSSWAIKEQHNIKLINIAALGNGNNDKAPAKFIDWLTQILVLPSGNIKQGILSTTAYIIPFHPRDFGCAYLPTSSEVSQNLEDSLIQEKLSLDAKDQVKLFIALTQLAGHPVLYDVLPQTGRFSKTVLANPYIARWYDIKVLTYKLLEEVDEIAENLNMHYPMDDVNYIQNVVKKGIKGQKESYPEHLEHLENTFQEKLLEKCKQYSKEMLLKQNQDNLLIRVKIIIEDLINKNSTSNTSGQLTENDITNQNEIIGKLISEGLWPSPGGAWNSAGIPIYYKMANGGAYPEFKHYDFENNDVTSFANLNCQTPFYFVYLENDKYNQPVIDFYVEFLKKLQKEYNFDGFRVDHIDHIVDKFSEKEGEIPISYRAPRTVLGNANRLLKAQEPHFALLAEYMLWDNFYKEYHFDMSFDLLWGNDIVSQHSKSVAQIINDNKTLANYNANIDDFMHKLSILKTYNNQDGEFREINQYPGQLGVEGALFKFFKMKTLPGGTLAQRPVLFIDGDESYTKTGIEKVIGDEISMVRAKNHEFTRKFNAINNFALNNHILQKGTASIHQNNDESGFITWQVSTTEDNERLYFVANENPPTELAMGHNGFEERQHSTIYNKQTNIPEGYQIVSEYVLREKSLEFEELFEIKNKSENTLFYESLTPSQFFIYKIKAL